MNMYEVSNIERFAGLQTVNLTYVTAHVFLCMDKKFEDTKGVIRKPKSKKYGQYNGQRKKMTKKTKQWSTKHFTYIHIFSY